MDENTNKSNGLFRQMLSKIKEIIRLNDDTDVEATITSIKKSVEFKGANVWILAFAIIIASVGLNVNSTAVIIGAMLISPLMGPIIGLGLSVGITDHELLRKSLSNLAIMVFISLISSTLYFLISPLSNAQSELLARTTPTIFDVVIAFFGGAAGIIATSRKEQPFTIISGVAIATALMPPLCTAGYGIGTGQFQYFLGAFYLFFLNSFFIALATFLFVRYLQFPRVQYLDAKKNKIVKRSITLFATIVIIPSIFMAINVVRESSFHHQANKFITDAQKSELLEETQLVSMNETYHRKGSTIQLSLIGRTLSPAEITKLQNKLPEYGLTQTKLIVKQTGQSIDLDVDVQAEIIESLLEKKELTIREKDSVIHQMEKDISFQKNMEGSYPQIAKEISIQFPFIKNFSIANTVQVEVQTQQTITKPTLYISYTEEPSVEQRKHFIDWIKVRLEADDLNIVEL